MVKIRNQVTTGEFTSLFPVTDGTESRQITLDGFDKDKGVLVGVEMTVVATLISLLSLRIFLASAPWQQRTRRSMANLARVKDSQICRRRQYR